MEVSIDLLVLTGRCCSRTRCRFRSKATPATRTFAELLIDCEEDRILRAVLVGMLREAERSGPS